MKRLECLDGLRGVLAVYVMLGHMASFSVLPAWVMDAVSHGTAAVNVFFVLSGLVIIQSLDRTGGRAAPFLILRATRIFPVFLLAFALAVMLEPLSCGFDRTPWINDGTAARIICVHGWPDAWASDIITHLLMIHGLFPNGVLPYAWIDFLGSAWSLSTEWQFYLVALLVALVPGRGGPRRLRNGLMLLAALAVAWRFSLPSDWHFSRAFLGNKAHFFALGVASVAMVQGRRGGMIAYGATLLACLAICAADGSVGRMMPPLVWTLCLAAQMWPGTPGLHALAWLLRCRAAQFLGAISYCVYLVNEPVHKILAAGLSRLADGNAVLFSVLWVPAAIIVPILVSTWLHRHVEMPAVQWGRLTARSFAVRRDRLAAD